MSFVHLDRHEKVYLNVNIRTKSQLLYSPYGNYNSYQEELYRLCTSLHKEGLGYRKISHELNRRNIKSHTNVDFYPSLVSNIYSKMMKKDKIMSQKETSEYRDFDIGVY